MGKQQIWASAKSQVELKPIPTKNTKANEAVFCLQDALRIV